MYSLIEIENNLLDIRTFTDPWISTPFLQNVGRQGYGTDCKHLVANLIKAIAGVEYTIPRVEHGQLLALEDVYSMLSLAMPVTRISTPITGAIVIYSIGKSHGIGLLINKDEGIFVNEQNGVTYRKINTLKGELNYVLPIVFGAVLNKNFGKEKINNTKPCSSC